MAAPQYSQAHLDALAQQQGFHDYNHWAAWNAHQQMMRQGNSMNGAPGPGQATQPAAPQNWLQHLLSSIPATPAYLLGKVNDAFGGATGQ